VKLMRILKYFFLVFFLLLLSNCSELIQTNGFSDDLNYRPNYPISETLQTPTLSFGIGIETGESFIHWTNVESVDFYELEKSYTEGFESSWLIFRGSEISFTEPGSLIRYYYRVRVIYNLSASKWSNIVHN